MKENKKSQNEVCLVVSDNNGDSNVIGVFSTEDKAKYFIDKINANGTDDPNEYIEFSENYGIDEYVEGKKFFYKVELNMVSDKDFKPLNFNWYIDFLGTKCHELEILGSSVNSVCFESWGHETKYFVFVKESLKDSAFKKGKNLICKEIESLDAKNGLDFIVKLCK